MWMVQVRPSLSVSDSKAEGQALQWKGSPCCRPPASNTQPWLFLHLCALSLVEFPILG